MRQPICKNAEALLKTLGSQLERNTAPASETREVVEDGPVKPGEPSGLDQRAAPPQPAPSSQAERRSAVSSQQSPEPDPAPNPQPLTPSLFRQEGEYWTLAFEGTVCRVRNTLGMQYLARLLLYPHHEFHVLTLVSGGADPGAVPSHHAGAGAADSTSSNPTQRSHSSLTDAGEVLDAQAKAAYKQRLQELQAELEEAQAWNDAGRVEKVQAEIAFLTDELTRAVGLGGRVRKAASPAERARVNVTLAIRTARKRITANHPALGQYLSRTIKTGYFCAYIPNPTHRFRGRKPL